MAKTKKVIFEVGANFDAMEKAANKAAALFKQTGKEIVAAAQQTAAETERAYNRLGNKAGFFTNVRPTTSMYDRRGFHDATPEDPFVRSAMRGFNSGVRGRKKQEEKDRLKALSDQELAERQAEARMERDEVEAGKLRRERARRRLRAYKARKNVQIQTQAQMEADEEARIDDEASAKREEAKRRLRRIKAKARRRTREANFQAKEDDFLDSAARQDAIDKRKAKRRVALARLKAWRASSKARRQAAASTQAAQDEADANARMNYQFQFKERKRQLRQQKIAERKRRMQALRNRRRAESARRQGFNRFVGQGQAVAGFAGAAIGSSLFQAGGSMGGGFANVPAMMAQRAFAGGAVGAMVGAPGGPIGLAAGIGIGAGIGGLMGLLEGGIPAAINALTSGVQKTISILHDGASRLMKAGAEYERQVIKYGVLTGSAATGRKHYEGIESLSTRTPYTLPALSGASELLLGYGLQSENAVPAVARLGDLAGGDATRLERLALAFGQVVAQGKVAGQELRQFSEAGIGIEDFAKTAQMSTFQFRAAMENSQIPASVMINTVNRLTNEGGRFFQMNEKISQTTSGRWQMLEGSLAKYERRLGDFLNKKVDAAGWLGWLTEQLPAAAQKAEKMLNSLVEWGQRAADALSKPFLFMKDVGINLFDQLSSSSLEDSIPTWNRVGDAVENMAMRFSMAIAQMIDAAQNAKRFVQADDMPWNWKIWEYSKYIRPTYWGYEAGKAVFGGQRPSEGQTDQHNQFYYPNQMAVQRAHEFALQRRQARSSGVDYFANVGPTSSLRAGAAGATSRPLGIQGTLANLGMGTIRAATPDLKVKESYSGDINKLIGDLTTAMKDGLTPLNKFGNEMRLLQSARFGQPASLGPAITQKQFEFGRYQAFENIRKGFEQANEIRMPESGKEAGSEAAARAIRESLEVSLKQDLDHMEILKLQKEELERVKSEVEKLNKFFEDNKDKMKIFIETIDSP